MSKLDELIQELCPNGVEYKELEDSIISLNTGLNPRKFFKLNTEDACNYYVTIREIQNNTICFSDKTDKINDEAMKLCNNRSNLEIGDVLFSGTGTIGETAIIDEKPINWNIKEGVYSIKVNRKIYNPKFLMYLLQDTKVKNQYFKKIVGGTVKSIPMKSLRKLKLPVPPLEVQREIVRILDSFTLLTAELTAELTARKKQYEYYRDELLSFHKDIKSVELGDVCTFVRGPFGGALKKESFKHDGYAVYEQQHAIYRNHEIRYFIDYEKFNELKRFSVEPGDMIVSCSGTIGKTYIIPNDAPKGIINQALLKLKPNKNIDVHYLQYFFENTISKLLNGVARGGAIKNVPSVAELKKIIIPLPSIKIQKRLVQVLDKFDAICSDLNIGLPAEIEARQKQYEYYRDKLLSF